MLGLNDMGKRECEIRSGAIVGNCRLSFRGRFLPRRFQDFLLLGRQRLDMFLCAVGKAAAVLLQHVGRFEQFSESLLVKLRLCFLVFHTQSKTPRQRRCEPGRKSTCLHGGGDFILVQVASCGIG